MKRVIFSHSIGSAIVGTIPLVDLVVQNLFTKTTAVKKLGQIFGINLEIDKDFHLQKSQQGLFLF